MGIVIVSHSVQIAQGVAELAAQMAPDVPLRPVGGAADGSLGTDASRIAGAIADADQGAGVLVVADLGSAILATSAALEILGGDLPGRTRISGGPLVEGAVLAAVQASIGEPLEAVLAAAESAAHLDKGVSR